MCRPKPLYHSTASQLGLHKTRGIPNLLDFVLPRTAPQVGAVPPHGPMQCLSPFTLLPFTLSTRMYLHLNCARK